MRGRRLLLVVGAPAGTKMAEHQSIEKSHGDAAMLRGRLLIFDAVTLSTSNLRRNTKVGEEFGGITFRSAESAGNTKVLMETQ